MVHENFQSLALRLIDKNGRQCRIVDKQRTAPDPNVPHILTESERSFGTKAVFFGERDRNLVAELAAGSESNQTAVFQTDTQALIPALNATFNITNDMELEDTTVNADDGGPRVWAIRNAAIVRPGPTDILWILSVVT